MTSHNLSRTAAAVGVFGLLSLTVGVPLLTMVGRPEGANDLDGEFLPATAAAAYQAAAQGVGEHVPGCRVPAWLLAGIGEVESAHGTSGDSEVLPNGNTAGPIVGPALPRLGPDTDQGAWDGSTTVDHAVGPMQFIPETWRHYGLDGNDDGQADPHNIFDAALAAAALLCDIAFPMAQESDWRHGLYGYNHSSAYVESVLAAGARYRNDAASSPGLESVAGIGPTSAAWVEQVMAMLEHARADGVVLTGSSHRSSDQQIALRRAHCGTSHYAIYEMRPDECSPPTARPGTSNHERGLAIDFDRCNTRATACHRWLSEHAAAYGLHPLASEPWHWSIDGR